ncbi:uncharacterized protein [Argopecten irradians]|uniref:uncharacterized protein isoform X2 n=1 Tax=Argopecten irradians TaxID=31199 RepID=UPI00371C54E7
MSVWIVAKIAALVTERWFIAGKRGTGIGLFEINSKGYIFAGPSTASVIAISVLIWMSESVIREIHCGRSFYLGCGAAAANLFAAIVFIIVIVNREIEDDTSCLNSEGPEVMMGPTGSRTTGNTSYPLNDIPGQSSLPLSGLSDTIPLEVSENASRMYFQTAIKEYPQTYTVVKPQRNTVTRGCPTEYKLPQDDPSYKYDQDPGNDFLSQY